jgi:hypothetical protein
MSHPPKTKAARKTAAAEPKAARKTPVARSTPKHTTEQPREGSAMHAALTVLRSKRKPMTPQEIYDEALTKGLVKGLKGKTPVATLAAELARSNKAGRLVQRPAPGRYQLRK